MDFSKIKANLLQIAENESQKATQADGTKKISASLNLVEKSLRSIATCEKLLAPKIAMDPNLIFLAMLNERAKRSDIWIEYLDFCSEQCQIPLRKTDFFDLLRDTGFRVSKLCGDVVINPPRVKPKLLVDIENAIES